MRKNEPVAEIVEIIDTMTVEGPVRIEQITARFGRTAIAPMLLVPGLLLLSPMSGVPLFSSICGIMICLVAAQGAWGRDSLWLPDFIVRRKLDRDTAHQSMSVIRPVARMLDRWTTERIGFLTVLPVRHVLYGLVAIAGLCVPLLELIPFASSLVGLGTSLIAVGFLGRDGLLIVFGALVYGLAAAVPIVAINILT